MEHQGPRAPRYESLDMWRGVACLMVLVNHAVTYQVASGQPSGADHAYLAVASVAARLWAGVPIFFVISGYCISATVDSHGRRGSSVAGYFYRRFRRIFPPYWVVLLAIVIMTGPGDVLLRGAFTALGTLLRPWWYSPAQWLGTISLTEIWRTHITGGQKGLVLGPAWTLCYEEQFYAVCGALLFFWPRRFFTGAAVVTLAVLVTAALARATNVAIDGFFFDGSWVQFALGILLYYALNYAGTNGRRIAGVVFLTVLAVAAFDVSVLLQRDKNLSQEYFVAGAFAFAALVLRPFDRQFLQAPSLHPLRVCGMMCYSLYLVHMPVTNLLRAAVGATGANPMALPPYVSVVVYGAPSLWLAWQFHVAVERRFMSPPRTSSPAPVPTLAV